MPSVEEESGFGLYLYLFRKGKGRTLLEVSQTTKIPLARLQQLENEDLANLPDRVFVKGFVRAYAESVGADGQEALRRLDVSYHNLGQSHGSKKPITAVKPRSALVFWFTVLLGLLLLTALVAVTLTVDRWLSG